MKGPDKFIMGIVAAVALLVIIAFTVAFLRPRTYQPDDTPEGVAHNYLFALGQGDYARAYSYLSPRLAGYPPSAEAFADTVWSNRWRFRLDDNSITLKVTSARRVTDERAFVSVDERRWHQDGLFRNSSSTHTFEMVLRQEEGQWKIIASNSYWAPCWEDRDGCP